MKECEWCNRQFDPGRHPNSRCCSRSCGARARGRRVAMPFEDRFWAKVSIPVNVVSDCWLWRGSRGPAGHGSISTGRLTRVSAHRFSFEQARGPIPLGMFVCHHCDNPPCVNPAHLFLGTAQDNMSDKVAKGRHRDKYGRPTRAMTPELVREIRAQRASGVPFRDVAAAFGVSLRRVESIVYRKTWRHIQ